MTRYVRLLFSLLFALLLAISAAAQSLGGPGISGPAGGKFTSTRDGTAPFDVSPGGLAELNARMLMWGDQQSSPLQNPNLLISKLDLKAPKKAKQEFEKGYQLLYRKEYQGAVEHLLEAINIYPEFVAAHQALGSAYLALSKNEDARDEFAQAVVLDDHLPTSYFNLGRAELELKHYGSAEIAAQKAASIAPLDLKVLTSLAFAQLMNRNYPGTIATADQVHGNKGKGHSMVHFYAAAAWEAQNNPEKAGVELRTLLKEDPTPDAATHARQVLNGIQQDTGNKASAIPLPVSVAAPVQTEFQRQLLRQSNRQQEELTEAEAMCEACDQKSNTSTTTPRNVADGSAAHQESGWTLHSKVDEVAVFFVATDHGKPVRELTKGEVNVRDNGKAPASVVAFRSEDQLPLRLGLVIDASESVTKRFSFEQASAAEFVRKVLVGADDLGFAVGVSNSVLLVQDFTSDATKISAGINSLVPTGGTALWDAVSFAADKLAKRTETQPVARVLVVISDGQDNSSKTTLKQVIETAEHDGVSIYTISTSDVRYVSTAFIESTVLGNRALRTLAERTGGNNFTPGSVRNLDHSLADLGDFVRSRYLLAYKPAFLRRDDHYRTIDITAEKSGHKLRVYARKGYYVPEGDSAD
jgi:Ca-activated chloride channel homolog